MLRHLGVVPAAALPGAPLLVDGTFRSASVTLLVAVTARRDVIGVTTARHTGSVDRVHLKKRQIAGILFFNPSAHSWNSFFNFSIFLFFYYETTYVCNS